MLFAVGHILKIEIVLPKYVYTELEWQEIGSSVIHSIRFVNTYTCKALEAYRVCSNFFSQYDITVKCKVKIISIITAYEYIFEKKSVTYCNGFQSWSHRQEMVGNDIMRSFSPLAAKYSYPYGDSILYKYSKKKGVFHGWSYAYNRFENNALLIASLKESDGYTLIEFRIHENLIFVKKDLAKNFDIGSFPISQHYIEYGCFDKIFENWCSQFPKPKLEQTVFGWTSWYNHYTNINENIIVKNLNACLQYDELKYFQLDDGWQKSVGEWEIDRQKFPYGLKSIADKCVQNGKIPGLWLAPFIVEEKSNIVKLNPSWILKDENGKWVKAGFNSGWSGNFYALDFYNPEVKNYLSTVFKTVCEDWGFKMLKLDFLYAVALLPSKEKSRGAVMYDAMSWLRDVLKDSKILACGVPLFAAINHSDYCRIGPDISLGWKDTLSHMFNLPEGISTLKSLQNTIYRRQLKNTLLRSDPDVFILRNENTQLEDYQKFTLLLINCLFGSLCFTSDDVSQYDFKAKARLKFAFSLKNAEIIEVKNSNNTFEIKFTLENNIYLYECNLEEKIIQSQSGKKLKPGEGNLYLDFNGNKDWKVIEL